MNNLFWGVLVLLFGLSIIFKAIFGFTFPIMKPLLGAFFIYLGIMMIFNIRHGAHFTRWGDSHVKISHPARQYSVVFGNGTIDLSQMEMPKKPIRVKLNTVFGQSDITLNKKIPTRIRLNSIFSEAQLPYEDLEQTGSDSYQMGDEKALLNLEINVVFGKTVVNAS